ncbi:TPA: hypothetical protein QCX40_003679 [Bacillus cereus]|nr:hypothetical protein [Bacillus cereus]
MNEELSTFIDESIICLDNIKQERTLDNLLPSIINSLEEIISPISDTSKIIIQGRVKGSSSLREKILRKRYFTRYQGDSAKFINELPDLIGLRIICLLNQDEERIYKLLKSKFSLMYDSNFLMQQGQSRTNYPYFIFSNSKQPEKQKNGNDIYRINMEYMEAGLAPIKIELQIKSLSHMFWGEMEHMLFYKNYTYHLNSGFYIKMMSSINDVLKSIDSQLTNMYTYLSNESCTLRQMDDMKELIAKTLYDRIQPQVKTRIKSDVDLREVYNIIVQLLFFKCTTVSATFEESKSQFPTISSLDLVDSDFDFDEIIDRRIQCNRKFDTLLFKLNELVNSNDIFWEYFMAIYKKIIRKDYQYTLENITTTLMDPITMQYQEKFDVKYESFNDLLDKAILRATMESFSDYGKMDFFLPDAHRNEISHIIEKFIDFQYDTLKEIEKLTNSTIEITETNAETITSILKYIVKLELHYYLHRKINKNDLNELLELNKLDTNWDPSIDTNKLVEIFEEIRTIKNSDELIAILHFTPKDEEE